MKNLKDVQIITSSAVSDEKDIQDITSNDILNLAPENGDELAVLQALQALLKKELLEELISDIKHKLR